MSARPTATAMKTASRVVLASFSVATALRRAAGHVRLEHRHPGAQRVEVGLAGGDVRAQHGFPGRG